VHRGLRITASGCAIAVALGLGGCGGVSSAGDPERHLPPAGAGFDYQLGGAYEPPTGAAVIARDSTAAAEPGSYNICYVNGFQTQPGEGEQWLAEHPDLVLRDADGEPFIDPGWPDEYLLDISSGAQRARILDRIDDVIASCASGGFDAVEIDNLDSWTRSADAFTIDAAIELAAGYADVAHGLGLAIAQKNGAGHSQRFRDEVGFDFAVTEECAHYDECAEYLAAYDGLVFDIEYDAEGWEAACAAPDRPASMILRDLDLARAGEPGYLRETC
jgi:hypothetical protein